MVHGPYGGANPNCPCIVDGHCSKAFPKEFQSRTTMNQDGYPKYKHPNDGQTIKAIKLAHIWLIISELFHTHLFFQPSTTAMLMWNVLLPLLL